jgi:hypothetical protein
MKLIRQRSKSTGVFLVILMVLVAVPYQSVLAAMIETPATLSKRSWRAKMPKRF